MRGQGLAVLTVFFVGYSPVFSGENGPRPFPAEIVSAWEKRGVQVGWMDVHKMTFREGKVAQVGDLPAFFVSIWKKGQLAELPQPKQEFGMRFAYAEASDECIEELTQFKFLRVLDLDGCNEVTDNGLKVLGTFQKLQALRIFTRSGSEIGMAELTKLEGLEAIDLYGPNANDAMIRDMAEMKKLRFLTLRSADITNDGMKDLAALRSLESLSLFGTNLFHFRLKEIGGMNSLVCLDLGLTSVNDDAIKDLSQLKNLKWLSVSSLFVSDNALEDIAKISSLESLDLSHTGCSSDLPKDFVE